MAGRRARARCIPRPAGSTQDVDIVVAGDPERAARALPTAADAHLFPLSERFGAWRTIARDRSWQADLTPLRGDGIEADLALRDFTVNAMARPLEAIGTACRSARRGGGPGAGSPACRDRAIVRGRPAERAAPGPLRLRAGLRRGTRAPRRSPRRAAAPHRRGRAGALVLRAAPAGRERRPGRRDRAGRPHRAPATSAPGAGSAEGSGAEPLPPPGRVGAHARGAGAAGRDRARAGGRVR